MLFNPVFNVVNFLILSSLQVDCLFGRLDNSSITVAEDHLIWKHISVRLGGECFAISSIVQLSLRRMLDLRRKSKFVLESS